MASLKMGRWPEWQSPVFVTPFLNSSHKVQRHCDMLLDMSEMSVPEEAQDMYLTIYVKENKGLQIINSVDPKEMDNYIWRKKK